MDVIWDKGSATVAEVAETLPKELGLAYNTVLTTMRILEDKGYVRHTVEGTDFIFRPIHMKLAHPEMERRVSIDHEGRPV